MGHCMPKVDKNGEIVYEVLKTHTFDRIQRVPRFSDNPKCKIKQGNKEREISIYITTNGFCNDDYEIIHCS